MTETKRAWNFLDWWYAPIDPARFRLWQRAFSVCFLIWAIGWSSTAREWLTDFGFHITPEATNPVYPMPFPLVPQALLIPFLLVMFGNTLLMIADRGGRPVRLLQFALAVYVQLVDQPASFTLNKLFIFGYFLLAFMPAPVTVRVDGEDAPREVQSAWPLRMIQATLLIQYMTAGTCKAIWGDWLEHTDILFGHSVGVYRTWIAGLVVAYAPKFMWHALSVTSLLFEMFAPVFFIWPKTRLWTCAFGVCFHMGIALLMKDLIYFSIQMCSFYIVFLPTAWCVLVDGKIESGLRAALDAVRAKLSGSPPGP